MKEKINPIGLKGKEINERMKQLMGIKPINENKKTSVVELTKKGPDGNVYAIVRENHEYYIKITQKQNNLVVEDFQYIGGLQNKKQEVYPSYAKAIKHLNLKFHSLNEAYGKSGQVNVFLDDKLLTEDYAAFESMGSGFKSEGNMDGHSRSECCEAQVMEGMCLECGGPAYGMMSEKKYSDEASEFISKEISHLMNDKDYSQERAVAAALSVAREKGYKVPEKSDEGMAYEMEMNDGSYVDRPVPESEELAPEMAAIQAMMDEESEMTDKEKKFAALAPPHDKITYADKIAGATKGKNEGKLSIERAMEMMDEMIDELHESQSKKKL